MTSPNDVAANANAGTDNPSTPGVSSVAHAWSAVIDFAGDYATNTYQAFNNYIVAMSTIGH